MLSMLDARSVAKDFSHMGMVYVPVKKIGVSSCLFCII